MAVICLCVCLWVCPCVYPFGSLPDPKSWMEGRRKLNIDRKEAWDPWRHLAFERSNAWLSSSFIAYSAGALLCPQSAATKSCLPPGRCKANVLLAKVCLHCTKPGVARSSQRSLPIGRQPPDHRSDSTVVILLWWAAGNMSKEPQTSVSD